MYHVVQPHQFNLWLKHPVLLPLALSQLSSDWLTLNNRRTEQQVGGASVFTAGNTSPRYSFSVIAHKSKSILFKPLALHIRAFFRSFAQNISIQFKATRCQDTAVHELILFRSFVLNMFFFWWGLAVFPHVNGLVLI